MDDHRLAPQIPTPRETIRKKKDPFSPEEDAKLRNLMGAMGQGNWTEIAGHLPGRTPRQCRERWKLYLSPELKLEPWSLEDEQRLLKMYFTVGPKWTLIARTFPDRTSNNVKNKAKQSLRRIQKLYRTGDQPQLSSGTNQAGLSLNVAIPDEQRPPT
jgi:hypothetical protein